MDQAMTDRKNHNSHLGGNVYCNIADKSVCVDIRQYWKPQEEVVPTKKGLCLRPDEYKRLKELAPEIGKVLPELDSVVPCYMQSDHMNQLGVLQCSECNPNDFYNW
ncbi:MAG: transcriptional coactivator p15/PC4 family protein, partial [Candidatus Thiodiazotropha sp.]